MNIKAGFLYSFRLIFSKNKAENGIGHRSFVGAMICIGISLIPLVAVLVLSNGMINGITGRIIGLSTQHISVFVTNKSNYISDYKSLIDLSDRLNNVNGIEEVYPEIQGNALVSSNSYRTGAIIRAVESDIFSKNESFSSYFEVIEGSSDLTNPKSAVIGKSISETLNLHAGDTIRILSISTNQNSKIIPKVSTYTVSGIVSSGYQELDAIWVFIPLESGFSAIAPSSQQFSINLTTKDAFSSELYNVKLDVQDELLGVTGNEPVKGSYVYCWNEINQSQFENFSSTKALLLLIMILIVLVASVNISSALIMIVMERKKEIAILKSVGATSEGIAASFLITGFSCGLGGLLLGIPIGLFCAVNINEIIFYTEKIVNFFVKFWYILINKGDDFSQIYLLDPAYYLQKIPITVPFKDLFIIGFLTLFLSVIVSAIPAIKAGKEKPINTLRKM